MKSPAAVRLTFLTLYLAAAAAAIEGCNAAQKQNFNRILTGNASTQPATATTQPTGNSVMGVTQTIQTDAGIVAAATPPGTPPNTIASLVAALAGGALVLERMLVYIVGKIPNSKSSDSNSATTSGAPLTSTGSPPTSSTSTAAAEPPKITINKAA